MRGIDADPLSRAAKRGKAGSDLAQMGTTQRAAALNGTAPRALRQVAAFPSLTFLDCGGGGNCAWNCLGVAKSASTRKTPAAAAN
eukprot:1415482-Alexandrium_andersonii.AAC.1